MSTIPLRYISGNVLHALAVVLSLPPDSLEETGRHTATPSATWQAEQAARIPGLPRCLLIPPIPHLSVKVAQVAKRVVIAAAGGADTLAVKAASKGIRLDAVLHPCSTPTALCPAHRDLHPNLVREMFFYLSREVADNADFVRRHPVHDRFDNNDHDNGVNDGGDAPEAICHTRDVHDWGLRMIGISALWCTRHTFRALEKGRQVLVAASRHRPPMSAKAGSSAGSSTKSPSQSSSQSSTHIRSSMRMPHLQYPCEACILAAVGARSQTLIDLRASMLSRMAEEHHDKQRRDRRRGTIPSSSSFDKKKKPREPNLLPLVETYINVLGREFGDEMAAEIRARSEALAESIFDVRLCEARRRRHVARDVKRLQRQGESARYVRDPCTPRLVTKHGHRLPLPLLPLDCDLWAHYNESVVGGNKQNYQPTPGRAHGADPSGAHDESQEQYYVVPDEEVEQGQDEADKAHQHELGGKEACDKQHPSMMGSDYLAHLGYNEYFAQGPPEPTVAEETPAPEWEDDYRRNVLESETVFSSDVADERPWTGHSSDDDHASYVTISVYTQLPLNQLSSPVPGPSPSHKGPSRRAAAASPSSMPVRGLSPIPGTPTSTAARSMVSSVSRRPTRSTRPSSTSELPPRPANPTPSSQPRTYPPAPTSSVYSRVTAATQNGQKSSKAKQAFSTILSEANASQASASSASRAIPSPRPAKASTSTAPSASSSLSSLTQPTASSSYRSRAPSTPAPATRTPARAPRAPVAAAASTAFVPPSNGRKPTSVASYVAMQAVMDASRSRSRVNAAATTRTPTTSTLAKPCSAASTASKTTKSTSTTSKAPTERTSQSTVSKSSPASTVTDLSRYPLLPRTTYQPPSMTQRSAMPPPLFSKSGQQQQKQQKQQETQETQESQEKVRTPTRPSRASPRTTKASTSTALPKTPTMRKTPESPKIRQVPEMRNTPKAPKSPSETSSDVSFDWSQSAPSDLSVGEGPRHRPDYAIFVDDDHDNDNGSAGPCSIAPDDSISAVAGDRHQKETDRLTRQRCESEAEQPRRWLQKQRQRQQQTLTAPTRPGRGQQGPIPRILNHYQPNNSRRPPQAPPQAPPRAPPQPRQPMRPRTQAEVQNKPLPRLPAEAKTQRCVCQGVHPRKHHTCGLQEEAADRPTSNLTNCTAWPKCF
ncbi:hypothetical protein SPBR_00102 [Sporothrix brasiliensis 5110]|uniref:Uncharacterized protein n=1 Tax=Sporothrix brasiliensis 5110 TaxID=1398154 RepID=A0A0C2EVF7_9PEZI|nr:uncharacterized protein SPBR_00102 [Sporothrix brasiliensis 5110]KIH90564.1 hypothetical protein SPBR_00102 [Sporothrix brasiliensis 5110]